MTYRLVLIGVLSCTFWTGATCIPVDSSSPAIRDTDLVYREIGEFRAYVVRIDPDGQVFIPQVGQHDLAEPVGQLSNEQGNRLNVLLQGWDSLPPIVAEYTSLGDISYGITYRDREQSWIPGQLGVPLRLYEIAHFVRDVAKGLE